MMYPYAEFLLDFDRKHGSFTHHNSPENTRAAVIVETRPQFFLPKVIRNTMFFLGPRWNLHVFCGELSHDYIQDFLKGWSVRVTKFPGLFHLSVTHYSGIVTSPSFWSGFAEDKLLIFQSDSILCGPNIEDFIAYDYVGAPCGRFDEQYIANGGLSLRTRRVMLDCVERFRPGDGVPEDVFFTSAVRQMGAAMPDMATACRFAVESLYSEHPVGVHGTDKCFHSTEIAEKITRAIRY
jgi:hypothetical protein